MDWLGWFGGEDYEFAREVVQRGTAALYVVAFVSAVNQFPVLLGERGLLPAPTFLRRARYRDFPSIFHWRYSDRFLVAVSWAGAILAATLVIGLPQLGPPWLPLLAFLVLWALYLSIVNIGQTFYGFGWESLLVEAGFVVAFLGSNDVAPPILIIFFLRWLLFRLEFGAGMIKIRGGSEWRDLTAMYYHHETQPMPNPVSWFAHHTPRWFHRCEVVGNHVVQLVVPFLLFAPQPVASIAALLIIASQLFLVLTGNFSWLNWITIVIAFSGISDGVLRAVFPWVGFEGNYDADPIWWVVLVTAAFLFLAVLSYRPLRNLFARRQLMNASFNRYHLVNAYGAFGTITKERTEVIIEGTDAEVPDDDADWRPYEFMGKPGDPARMPPQVAPYHLRLDWLMWFLALGSRDTRWFQMLLLRLLEGDGPTLRLLRGNPFPDHPPRWIRAQLYLYRYSTPKERREQHVWWVRVPLGLTVAPVTLRPDTRR